MSKTAPSTQSWGMDQWFKNQNNVAQATEDWESNPLSWQTPEQCPWTSNLLESFEMSYDEIQTLLDVILLRYPMMSEAFQESMMNNLMFKEAMSDPNFPMKFTSQSFTQATKAEKIETLQAMEQITSEVLEFLKAREIPATTDGTQVHPILLTKNQS